MRVCVCVCVCACVRARVCACVRACERVLRLASLLDASEGRGAGRERSEAQKAIDSRIRSRGYSQQRMQMRYAGRVCEARDAMRLRCRWPRTFGRDWEHSTPDLVLKPAKMQWRLSDRLSTLDGDRIRSTPWILVDAGWHRMWRKPVGNYRERSRQSTFYPGSCCGSV